MEEASIPEITILTEKMGPPTYPIMFDEYINTTLTGLRHYHTT